MTTENTPTFFQVIDTAIDQRLDDVFVAVPGRIESYDASERSADVKPLIRVAHLDETNKRVTEELPVIARVPVMFPGMGDGEITFPVSVGDYVMLHFASHSIDTWLETAQLVDSGDDRRHSISDAFAVPGIRPFKDKKAANQDAVVIDRGSSELRLGSPTANDPVARKSDLDNIKSAITAATPGSSDGGLQLKTQILSNWPSVVGAANVKTE